MATALAPGAAHAANSTTSTGLGPSTTSHSNSIRQPARQTRTNPSRTSKTASRTTFASLGLHGSSGVYGLGSGVGLGGAGAGGAGGGARRESAARNIPHGLYPAITHFTDAITALPKEFRRHASLLKEVDGKAWALEEALSKQLDAATASTPYAMLMQGGIPTKEPINYDSPEALARRKIFFDLRSTLSDLMITTDEKNHVLWNANNELEKQIRRIDATFPYTIAKTTGNTSERPRRETAATRDHNLAAALEGEARREGVSRKHRRTYGDVDAEDGRIPSRKSTGGKGKSSETLSNIPIGAGGAAASSAAPAKRRRVEKPQTIASATGSAMERSASTTTNAGTGRGAVKDVSATDGAKKRVRAPNANPTGRKRTNTTASATGSPALLPSSAILPLNTLTKAASPAPNIIPATPSSRSQLASTQVTNGRQRPSSSASNRAPNSSTLPGPTPACITRLDVPNPVVPTAEKPTSSDPKPSTLSRDTAITRIEPTSSTLAEVNKDEKASPSISTTPRPAELVPKQEDTAPASYNNINNSNANSATKAEAGSSSEPQPKGRSSKNSTPVLSTLPDLSQQHSQPQRTTRPRGGTVTAADGGGPGGPSTSSNTGAGSGAGTTKRSHKKGAGLAPAAQQLVAAAATEDEDSSRQGDDEEEEGEPSQMVLQ
ncbi:PHD finger domain-containing protein [Histoplasma capsulatum]|uniref:PHD finger domain-containing protein n=1 Tax=Ajellomyces capsulatus TaxID=5037 RepID=A0A8A1M2G0_AJECA|nr:PHD finger domain-containing protein [Histoplasma capsulatum]